MTITNGNKKMNHYHKENQNRLQRKSKEEQKETKKARRDTAND